MTREHELQAIEKLVSEAQDIVILQADNPDGDSLATSLALEQMFGDMNKEVYLYCGVEMPTYLRYLEGWDRVSKDMPMKFDLSIIVDTSAISLFETLQKKSEYSWVAARPCIVFDHHDVESDIPFATIVHNKPAVSTGELIYEVANDLSWPLNLTAKERIAVSILSDSLGLMSEGTSARSIVIISKLVESGVSLAQLEADRRNLMRKSLELTHYKGELLKRVELFADDRVAVISIPWEEIEKYSQAYNPSMLVIDEMRMIENVRTAIAFKTYPNGKITAKIRCNQGSNIAADLAKHFGGGGHPYASGFKVSGGRTYDEVKRECIEIATKLIDKLEKDTE
jgi:bifunctional oligoribonuclease and PAP phosphatase NrnA